MNQSSSPTSSSPTPHTSTPQLYEDDLAQNDAKVGVIMGSQSDWETMQHCAEMLTQLNISFDARIVSAHRTPEVMVAFAKQAENRGFSVIIACAGGAAHLPGMVASLTLLPVIGVPAKSATLAGIDSLLSIMQMPAGVPVATMAIGKAGAVNAALFAARILANSDDAIHQSLERYHTKLTESVLQDPIPHQIATSEGKPKA